MATGDQADCLARIQMTLPSRWFGDSNPILNAVLNGLAYSLALIYSLVQYAKLQTRISTASDGFLDLISYDFFGVGLLRRSGELDAPYRLRIKANLLRERATRNGMISTLTALTGRAPKIFEPKRPADTGALTIGLGLGVGGGVGSFVHPSQAFMVAYRPSSSGIPYIAGLGNAPCGLGIAGGAVVASLSWVQGYVTDADIYAAIDACKPAGSTMWVQLSN